MGLDQPIWQQYFLWLRRFASGDLGNSFINDFPVSDLILRRLPATLQLAIAALLLALVISIPLGVVASLWQGRWPDRVITLYSSLAMGIPDFWLGILLVLFFSLRLGQLGR